PRCSSRRSRVHPCPGGSFAPVRPPCSFSLRRVPPITVYSDDGPLAFLSAVRFPCRIAHSASPAGLAGAVRCMRPFIRRPSSPVARVPPHEEGPRIRRRGLDHVQPTPAGEDTPTEGSSLIELFAIHGVDVRGV